MSLLQLWFPQGLKDTFLGLEWLLDCKKSLLERLSSYLLAVAYYLAMRISCFITSANKSIFQNSQRYLSMFTNIDKMCNVFR